MKSLGVTNTAVSFGVKFYVNYRKYDSYKPFTQESEDPVQHKTDNC